MHDLAVEQVADGGEPDMRMRPDVEAERHDIDGVIEAIEDPRLPFAVGVQWHAETPDAREAGRRLRYALVEAAHRHAGNAAVPLAA